MMFLVPVTMFAGVAAIVIAIIIQNGKYKLKLQETVRHSIDAGSPLSADAVRALVAPQRDDLRTGLILVAVWGAFILFGVLVSLGDLSHRGPDWEPLGPLAGIGAFPGLIGVALIVLHLSRKGGR